MNRRGFFGGLIGTFCSYCGLTNYSKAGESPHDPTWLVDLWNYAANGLDGIMSQQMAPNAKESRQHLLRGIVRDLEEYGRSMLWVVRDRSGVDQKPYSIREVHRVLLNWWSPCADKRIPVYGPDLPTYDGPFSREDAPHPGPPHVLIDPNDVVYVELPTRETWLRMRFVPKAEELN